MVKLQNLEIFEIAHRDYDDFTNYTNRLRNLKLCNDENDKEDVRDFSKNGVGELCKNVMSPTKNNIDQGSYLGILTAKDAEKKIDKKGQFAIYHRLPRYLAAQLSSKRFRKDNLEPSPTLYLNIVYLDSNRIYRHYPIVESVRNLVRNNGKVAVKQYYVSCEIKSFDDNENSGRKENIASCHKKPNPTFESISRLIDHYTKFAYGYHFNDDGGIEVDTFPF